VYWDQLDMPLEDIDRIEVIRGPGATIWGANAVNGVINIITKSSKATQGGLMSLAAGSGVQPVAQIRYGGAAGQSGTYRAFGRYTRFGDTRLDDGASAGDSWSRMHGGFRSDWSLGPSDSLTVQGDLFSNQGGQTRVHWFYPSPVDSPYHERLASAGGNLMANWSHISANGAETAVRAVFDTYRRSDVGVPETMKSLSLDFQNHFAAGARHDVVWGLSFRNTRSGVAPGYPIQLSPSVLTDQLYSGFLQDEISLASNLWLTVGSKIEHNSYTGFEYEPSARLAWSPTPRQTFWAAAARAIRQPSRQEESVSLQLLQMPVSPVMMASVRLQGDGTFRSEELRDFEAGYRAQWSRRVSFDADAFLSFYRYLGTYEMGAPEIHATSLPIVMAVTETERNLGRATGYGGEVSVVWTASSKWRISPGYSLLHLNPTTEPGSTDTASHALALDAPWHQFQIRSQFDLTRKLEWDQSLFWTARFANGTVPAHARLDTRLSWRTGEGLELSLVGQNLLRPGFVEFRDTFQLLPTQAPRSIFGTITWKF
jgi:iron complex outermembrane receptor protein